MTLTGKLIRPLFARYLHSVSLALWLGGLVAIGALVAPTAFHIVRSSAVFAGTPAVQNAVAGGIVGGSLRLFNVVCYVCGVLLLIADALLLPHAPRRWIIACAFTTTLLLASALYLGFFLTPAMDAAQRQNAMLIFDTLHHQYEQISVLFQLPLLLLLGLLAAFRDTLRR